MIDVTIHDGKEGQRRAEVNQDHALRVTTEPYFTYSPAVAFFTNQDYGIELNKNWSNDAPGNSNERIFDGEDTVLWTGTNVGGLGWTLDDTNNPYVGTNNISCINGTVGSTIQCNRGSNVTMSTQTGFSIAIDVTDLGHPQAGLDFYAYNTATGIVGNAVDLYDYTGGITVGYVVINIPLADMGLTTATFDAVRFGVTTRGGAIVDLDEIILTDPTGGSAIGTTDFELAPPRGKQWRVNSFVISMADAYAGTVSNGTMPSLRYDGFLAEDKLTNGILFRVFDNVDRVSFAGIFTQLMDFMQIGVGDFSGQGSDGINSWFSLRVGFTQPIVLNDDEKDKIQIRLSDDLSGLLWFRWSANIDQRTIF